MSELNQRKQTILRAVIFEYIREAEPVGSELLASKYEWGVKSATVRNELADLADLGFLEQPHTSAGRIPSDLGYRYYVDNLIADQDPAGDSQQKVRGATSEGDALQALLQEATRVLSRLTHQLTAASVVRDQNITIRSAVVSALGPKQAIVVLVLSNGHVENRMIEVPAELTLTELGLVNEWLTTSLVGQNLRNASRVKPVTGGNTSERLKVAVMTAVKSISKEINKVTVTTQGEEFLFAQPEFSRDSVAISELVDSLKESELLVDALQTPGDRPQVVTIGKEHRHAELQRLSLVRQKFYVGENEAGIIAIIGPTRMAYDTTIPLVNFTAKALSDSLTRFLG
ncbi:MAG: heat-inducible transcriptional repressor HrcA [Fimbriimonadaceae bacterium]